MVRSAVGFRTAAVSARLRGRPRGVRDWVRGDVMAPDGDMDDTDDWLFDQLAERLRAAHRMVMALPGGATKTATTRRLLAISDAAKHDLGRASRRLDTLMRELDGSRVRS